MTGANDQGTVNRTAEPDLRALQQEAAASNQAHIEVTESVQPIFQGKVISLQVDTVRLPDGSTATREVVKHPGAVAVLALHEDKMVVVEQYRAALGRSQVEVPAGKLDPGEDVWDAARRELQEETGYAAGRIRHLYSCYTSPGFADEMIHLFIADDLTEGDASPDDDEFLESFEITLPQALRLIESGAISDAKTILCVMAWQMELLKKQITDEQV